MAVHFDAVVQLVPGDSPVSRRGTLRRGPLQNGIMLCLAGAGHRAILFQVRARRRLSEPGYLRKLERVSDSSVVAGVLRQLGHCTAGLP